MTLRRVSMGHAALTVSLDLSVTALSDTQVSASLQHFCGFLYIFIFAG